MENIEISVRSIVLHGGIILRIFNILPTVNCDGIIQTAADSYYLRKNDSRIPAGNADKLSFRTEGEIGLGFCYEIDGENIVFRIGAEDAEIKGSLSITDADHAEIIWADGRKDSMTFVSEEGSDTFHFYTNEELCAMAIAYYTDATGEVAPLAAADLGTDTVTIQLYNNLGDHNSTYAWYQVNRLTGKVIDVN